MLESTLSEEKSKKEIRPSINHQRFKDLSLKKDSEEKLLLREKKLTTIRNQKKTKLNMKNFFLRSLRKEKQNTMLKYMYSFF